MASFSTPNRIGSLYSRNYLFYDDAFWINRQCFSHFYLFKVSTKLLGKITIVLRCFYIINRNHDICFKNAVCTGYNSFNSYSLWNLHPEILFLSLFVPKGHPRAFEYPSKCQRIKALSSGFDVYFEHSLVHWFTGFNHEICGS